ncbi:hypothetical protein ACFS2C_14940 [Prauserella oleivorans]|uniref:Secreted protein n=1 Tax=Prauserella oleivorans TaxID=1478153 RepID=A0ABW5WB44_9PSEU
MTDTWTSDDLSPVDNNDTTRESRRRGSWLPSIIAIACLAGGAAMGYTAHEWMVEPEIVTREVPGKIPQEDLDAYEAGVLANQDREAELNGREAELDNREASLVERETAVTEQEQIIAANIITDGVWTVGVDIDPGTYRAQGVSDMCYWEITASGSNGYDIVENDLPGGGNPTVTLSDGQDFTTHSCGEWRKQ